MLYVVCVVCCVCVLWCDPVLFLTGNYIIIIINNQVLRKIKIAVKSDVKNWAYISLR